jgi:hypothetical protein
MDIFMKTYLTVIALIFCVSALASDETGTVAFEHGQLNSSASSAGVTFFYLSGPKTGSPSCANYAGGERWVINNDWPAAKIQMSILLAAITSGKQVTVRGSGNCSVWGDTETAINIFIMP